MAQTLVLNSGSSSLKFQMFDNDTEEVLFSGLIDGIGLENSFIKIKANETIEVKEFIENHEQGLNLLFSLLEENNLIANRESIIKVGHRVVQGGDIFQNSVLVNEQVKEDIRELASLAPLHNIPNLQGIESCEKILPHAKNIACFDTEYHQSMPKESYTYAVPQQWRDELKVRRYGMHGTSYKYIANKLAEIKNTNINDVNAIVCHLGNGCSMTAIKGGKSLQTSMGLTPLQGLIMGTRSGDIDPALYEYIATQTGLNIAEITNILNKQSGMLALTNNGTSDARELSDGIREGKDDYIDALNIIVTRIVEYIGSYYFRLEGCDTIVLTAGIGENSETFQKAIAEKLEFLGLEIADEIRDEYYLTTKDSKVQIMIVPTNEEYQIFLDAKEF